MFFSSSSDLHNDVSKTFHYDLFACILHQLYRVPGNSDRLFLVLDYLMYVNLDYMWFSIIRKLFGSYKSAVINLRLRKWRIYSHVKMNSFWFLNCWVLDKKCIFSASRVGSLWTVNPGQWFTHSAAFLVKGVGFACSGVTENAWITLQFESIAYKTRLAVTQKYSDGDCLLAAGKRNVLYIMITTTLHAASASGLITVHAYACHICKQVARR